MKTTVVTSSGERFQICFNLFNAIVFMVQFKPRPVHRINSGGNFENVGQ